MKPDMSGKTVALVGNSSEGLKRKLGKDIDAHDVVIRMNAGVPSVQHFSALGLRTSILAVGTIQAMMANKVMLVPYTPLWFWKATRLGDRQWNDLFEGAVRAAGHRNIPEHLLWRVPKKWIHEAGEAVGGKPSGGIGLIHALVKHMQPASLSVFNIDFFGALGGSSESWWHTERPEAVIQRKHPHDGTKELAYFKTLGFEKVNDGWWKHEAK